jgi:hypothetical protein
MPNVTIPPTQSTTPTASAAQDQRRLRIVWVAALAAGVVGRPCDGRGHQAVAGGRLA